MSLASGTWGAGVTVPFSWAVTGRADLTDAQARVLDRWTGAQGT
jgi:hypothetical protein